MLFRDVELPEFRPQMISKKMNRLYVIDCGVILNLLYFRFRPE